MARAANCNPVAGSCPSAFPKLRFHLRSAGIQSLGTQPIPKLAIYKTVTYKRQYQNPPEAVILGAESFTDGIDKQQKCSGMGDEMVALTKPDKVVWIDGSKEQLDALTEEVTSLPEGKPIRCIS